MFADIFITNMSNTQGDSGGPLWQEVNGVKYLIGNTSWGSGTCDADVYPTIYSKNSAVIPWIQAQL